MKETAPDAEILKKLQKNALRLLNMYDKNGELQIKIPIRSVSNITYDKKLRQYVIGGKEKELNIKNISQSKEFTHLAWLMSYIKTLIEQNKTQTQRDIFYAAQTVNLEYEDQPPSDDAIHNIEAILAAPREDFHIMAKDRGFIFGDIDIELTVPGYKGQKRNLMSAPEGVLIGHSTTSAKFIRTKADKVIIAEKQAVFTRLLEDKAHSKYNAILIGSEGQFPRGLRLLSRRLSEELKLPTYIFTDSVTGDAPMPIKYHGEVSWVRIGEFIDRFIPDHSSDKQWAHISGLKVLGSSGGKIAWVNAPVLYRHKIDKPTYTLSVPGGDVTITGDHSVFMLENSSIVPVKGSALRPGQVLFSARPTTALLDRSGFELLPEPTQRSDMFSAGVKPVSIEKIEKSDFQGFVYDITTESQSFVCGSGDVLVHNSDPWGMHIANAAIFGSAGSSHLRGFNIPDAVWGGVYASDIKRFSLPSIPLDDRDLKRVSELKKDPHFQTEPWKSELEIFARERRKAELEAFSAKSFTYFVDDYLKTRLKELRSGA